MTRMLNGKWWYAGVPNVLGHKMSIYKKDKHNQEKVSHWITKTDSGKGIKSNENEDKRTQPRETR